MSEVNADALVQILETQRDLINALVENMSAQDKRIAALEQFVEQSFEVSNKRNALIGTLPEVVERIEKLESRSASL